MKHTSTPAPTRLAARAWAPFIDSTRSIVRRLGWPDDKRGPDRRDRRKRGRARAGAGGRAPGVVAAVASGDATHVSAAGVMAVDGPPMQHDTVFRISSVTKPITAAVVLSLIDDGGLGLEEPVDTLLPELAGRRGLRRPDGPLTDTIAAERAVCVRDLLTFTWGFG